MISIRVKTDNGEEVWQFGAADGVHCLTGVKGPLRWAVLKCDAKDVEAGDYLPVDWRDPWTHWWRVVAVWGHPKEPAKGKGKR